jgi:glycosidase
MTNGYPAGPTYQATPQAASEDGGVGLAPNQLLVNFLDNHDLPRFMFDEATGAEKTDVGQLYAALTFLYTWDGIPCLYYGTEQQFHGGVDPKNREDMSVGNPDDGFAPWAENHATFKLVQGLIDMRKHHSALTHGSVVIRWSTTVTGARRDAGIFGFERLATDEKALVVINASSQISESCAPTTEGGACMMTSFPTGTILKDVAPNTDGKTFTVKSDGSVDVTVPPRTGRVLVVQ